MDRNEDLLILGRDFLSMFRNTGFDWEQKKVKLGLHLIWEISDEPKRHNPQWKVKVGTKQPGAMAKLDVLLENYASLFPESPKGPRVCSMGKHLIETTTDQVVRDKIWPIAKKWEK